jgi:hypothetical protein
MRASEGFQCARAALLTGGLVSLPIDSGRRRRRNRQRRDDLSERRNAESADSVERTLCRRAGWRGRSSRQCERRHEVRSPGLATANGLVSMQTQACGDSLAALDTWNCLPVPSGIEQGFVRCFLSMDTDALVEPCARDELAPRTCARAIPPMSAACRPVDRAPFGETSA